MNASISTVVCDTVCTAYESYMIMLQRRHFKWYRYLRVLDPVGVYSVRSQSRLQYWTRHLNHKWMNGSLKRSIIYRRQNVKESFDCHLQYCIELPRLVIAFTILTLPERVSLSCPTAPGPVHASNSWSPPPCRGAPKLGSCGIRSSFP